MHAYSTFSPKPPHCGLGARLNYPPKATSLWFGSAAELSHQGHLTVVWERGWSLCPRPPHCGLGTLLHFLRKTISLWFGRAAGTSAQGHLTVVWERG